jgi:hypothetical protein
MGWMQFRHIKKVKHFFVGIDSRQIAKCMFLFEQSLISYVIFYYQLQGHLTIIFNLLFSFSISEQTDVAFFWYEYLRV